MTTAISVRWQTVPTYNKVLLWNDLTPPERKKMAEVYHSNSAARVSANFVRFKGKILDLNNFHAPARTIKDFVDFDAMYQLSDVSVVYRDLDFGKMTVKLGSFTRKELYT